MTSFVPIRPGGAVPGAPASLVAKKAVKPDDALFSVLLAVLAGPGVAPAGAPEPPEGSATVAAGPAAAGLAAALGAPSGRLAQAPVPGVVPAEGVPVGEQPPAPLLAAAAEPLKAEPSTMMLADPSAANTTLAKAAPEPSGVPPAVFPPPVVQTAALPTVAVPNMVPGARPVTALPDTAKGAVPLPGGLATAASPPATQRMLSAEAAAPAVLVRPRLVAPARAPEASPDGAVVPPMGAQPQRVALSQPADLAPAPAPAGRPVDIDQLIQHVTRTAMTGRDGEYSVSLRLYPEHLGEVTLQLRLTGREVQAHFAVTNAEARQAVEQRGDQLRQSLSDAGLALSGFQVTTGGGEGSSQQRQALAEFYRSRQPGRTAAATDATGAATNAQTVQRIRTAARRPGPGSLDTLA